MCIYKSISDKILIKGGGGGGGTMWLISPALSDFLDVSHIYGYVYQSFLHCGKKNVTLSTFIMKPVVSMTAKINIENV